MDKPLQVYPGREIRPEQTTSTPQPHPIASRQYQQQQQPQQPCPDGQEYLSGMDIEEKDQEKDPFDIHHQQLEQQRRSLPTTILHHDDNNDNNDNDINQGEEDDEEEKEEEETTSIPFHAPSSNVPRIWNASTSSSTTVACSGEARDIDVAARASSIGTRTRTSTSTRTRTRTRATRRMVVSESGVLFSSLLFSPSSSTLELKQGWDSNKLDMEQVDEASGSVLQPRPLAIVTSLFKEGHTEDMSTTGITTTRACHSRTHPSTQETDLTEHASSSHGLLSVQLMASSPTRASTATPSTPTMTTPTSSSSSSSSSSPFFSSSTATTPTTSSTSPSFPSESKADITATTPLTDQDCAICLDSILPKKHAKATLACRHEFHLSCISMAFSMGKEMVCPLCRYLHKDQPFMCLESDAKPLRTLATSSTANTTMASPGATTSTSSPTRGMNGRNRHNSIHLQQHLSNLVQHQRHHQRHRRDNSTSSQENTTPPSTPPATSPRGSSVLSSIPFFGGSSTSSAFHGRPVSSQLYNYNSPRDAYPSTSPFSAIPHGHYINMTTWFMLYGVPFSIAILFLAFLLGRAETLWSRVSCLVGSVICYMVCWAMAVACLLSQEDESVAALLLSPPVQHVTYPQQQIQGFPIEYEVEPETMAMGQGATHPAALSSYEDDVSEEVAWSHSPTFLAPYYPTPSTSPPQGRLSPAAALVQIATSSFSSAAATATHLLSFSQRWTTSRYAQDLQNRVMDLAEVLDDYSESFGEW